MLSPSLPLSLSPSLSLSLSFLLSLSEHMYTILIQDMKIKSHEFKELVKKVTALENRLVASPVHKHPQLEKLRNLCDKKALV